MDEELKELLEENLKLSRENNKYLKKLHRSHRNSQIMRLIYWLVIIGLGIGAYYYVQPYLESALNAYQGVLEQTQAIQDKATGLGDDFNNVKDLLSNPFGE